MVFYEYLNVCICVYNIGTIPNRICVIAYDFTNTVKYCAELFQVEAHEVDLRLVKLLYFV